MSDTTTTFGQRLAFYRQRARISQSELARRAGFDHSYVSRMESGNRESTRTTVDRLCTALGLSLAEQQDLYSAAGFLHPEQAVLASVEADRMRARLAVIADMVANLTAQIERLTPAPVARLGDAGEEVAA